MPLFFKPLINYLGFCAKGKFANISRFLLLPINFFIFYFIFNYFDFKNLAKISNKIEKLVEFTLGKKIPVFFFQKMSKYVYKNTVANQINNEL